MIAPSLDTSPAGNASSHNDLDLSVPAPARTTTAVRLIAGAALLLVAAGLALALGSLATHATTVAIATGAAVGAAVAAGAIGTNFLMRPIRHLTRSALAMSRGDRNARAPVSGDDEITDLARAINRFAGTHSRSVDVLRAERDLFASILDGMGDGVLVLDAEDRIVVMNHALCTVGRLDSSAIGKPLIEAIRNAALKEALDTVRGSDDAVICEIELGRPLPRKLLVRVSRLPQASAQRGTVAVFHDVTDLRRLETIRTDFVANVSHELRTPVTAISTASETLLAGAIHDPTDAAEFVDVIDRHAQRLRHLVDDLLDLSKIEAKSFRMVLGDLEVHPILAHVVELLADPARKRRVSVHLLPGSEGLRVRSDRRSLEQVTMNLLDNAIKYAGEGARVVLSAKSDGDRVAIRVKDNGIGISEAHLGRLFERFYRVDAGRSREVGGTGLGLSIVRHLVELMGGRIDVESEPGKGACFTVRLAATSGSGTVEPS